MFGGNKTINGITQLSEKNPNSTNILNCPRIFTERLSVCVFVRPFSRRYYVSRPPYLVRTKLVRMCRRYDVEKGSSKVKWGQIRIDCCMELKLVGGEM